MRSRSNASNLHQGPMLPTPPSQGPSTSSRKEGQGTLIDQTLRFLRKDWHSRGGTSGAWPAWLLGLLLALAVLLVYSNTLHGPFQYDDFSDIRDNLTVRRLWPIQDTIFIPGNGFMSRPVANLTFALNYAMGGLKPFSFHLTNLGIHICAALAFLGILRRTLSLPRMRDRFHGQIPTLSLATAALWALHPLLTESVSYITQRYESLMGLFALLTFYCLLRMVDSSRPTLWSALASLACLLALGSKEVAVSVPVLVLLFDRTFISGSFRRAWRDHRVLYLGLMVAWSCFAYVQTHLAGVREFAGFGLTTPWWRYALNQPAVILHYLRLALWPHPLNFDYFWPLANSWTQLLPGLLVVGALLCVTLWALIRKPGLAFLSICFFFILAPTSSVMPILDLAVEHRMYLPLVPVIVLIVAGVYECIVWINSLNKFNARAIRLIVVLLVSCTLSAFASLTYIRNEDYQSPLDLWRDAVAKAPNNPRAHHNYAFTLAEAGYIDEALRQYELSLKLAPNVPLFLCNYGTFLGKIGRPAEGLKHLRLAVQLDPNNYKFILNLGVAHWQKGSPDHAITCFVAANRLSPQAPIPYFGLAAVLLEKNDPHKALELIQKAIDLDGGNPAFHHQLGLIKLRLGDLPGARSAFEAAIRLHGDPVKMISDVAWAFHDHGMDREALTDLRRALDLKPDHTQSQYRLAWILATSSEDALRNGVEALTLAKTILGTRPAFPELLDLLAVSLAETGQFKEAQAAAQLALSQSQDHKEKWVPDLERRLTLFRKGQPFREARRNLPASPTEKTPVGI